MASYIISPTSVKDSPTPQNTHLMSVVISGKSSNLKDKDGGPLRNNASDILKHEIVGHAVPHMSGRGAGPDTGNAVENENKVRRQESGGGQRAPEWWHRE
jgi:hypothetical protein